MPDNVLTEQKFDMGRGESGRIMRLAALNKIVPMGNFGGGPGFRCLLVLFVLHHGSLLFRLLIVHEDRLTMLYQRLRKNVAHVVRTRRGQS